MDFLKLKPRRYDQPMKQQPQSPSESQPAGPTDAHLLPGIHDNVNEITSFFYRTHDLKTYPFTLSGQASCVLYLETLIDAEKLEHKLFIPLADDTNRGSSAFTPDHFPKTVQLAEVTKKMLDGFAVLLMDGELCAYLIEAAANFDRSPDEPQNEGIVRGSHLGFVENIAINLNLLRKGTKNRHLYIEYVTLGEITNTRIAIAYIKGIANEEVVGTIRSRVASISSDMVFSPGYFEEFIEDSTFSPFPQTLNTERPDRVCANLIEGRIAVFVDGTPTTIIAPVNFFSFYQSPDDYNSRTLIGSFIRLIRLCSFLIAVSLPAIYIAVIGFHFEVLPEGLVLTVKGAVDRVPYPPLIEALIMELTIELIREAGLRLPSSIGPTISIVGGLVIGDAIVKAGLVSNTMIVVVARRRLPRMSFLRTR